ncbi:MAG TPA: TonB-dependent receptor, partial [Flavobacteriales bacterium]|nr:TonB-dependent receptor [Flavobacteriales bacterium]
MRWLLFISFSVFQLIALGQSGTIRGFVYDKTSGEPVIFTNVFLKGTQIGASTDVNGYYSITKIPPGEYTISVSALGYGGGDEKISLGKGQILNQKLFIESKVEELGVV